MEYVKPDTIVIYNRYIFKSRVQSDTKTYDQLVTVLEFLVRDCNYYDREKFGS